MKLGELRHAAGAVKKKKRLGKGRGTGVGGTAGKGTKGQRSRSGGSPHKWFEGGQMPIQRRLPKRGFHPINRVSYQIIDVGQMAALGSDMVDREDLITRGLVRKNGGPVKLLSDGEITVAMTIKVDASSQNAKSKIEAAGGKLEIPAKPEAKSRNKKKAEG